MPLYEHQLVGAEWLAKRRTALLADPPGLGKTRTLIRALELREVRRPLIVCPAIVRTHWRREFEAMHWMYGEPEVRSYSEITQGGYQLMRDLIRGYGADSLVLDESHYTKRADAQRTHMLLGKDGYARRLNTVFAASGTPVPKHPGEFWTTLCTLFPEVAIKYGLRTHADCLARYCITRGRMVRGHWVEKVVDTQSMDEFRELLSEVMLRRSWSEVGLDVPAVDWQVVPIDCDVGFSADMAVEDGGAACAVKARLWAGESLDDIANDPHVSRMRRRLGELKVASAARMLRNQLEVSDEKLVVFAYHRSVLDVLRRVLAPFGVAYVDGDVSDTRRASAIDRFQLNPNTRVFLGQNTACQTGITLTAASRGVLVEPDWTAVVNHQLSRRLARIGQKSAHCAMQMLSLAGTLDDAIVRQHHRETRMCADILGEV